MLILRKIVLYFEEKTEVGDSKRFEDRDFLVTSEDTRSLEKLESMVDVTGKG